MVDPPAKGAKRPPSSKGPNSALTAGNSNISHKYSYELWLPGGAQSCHVMSGVGLLDVQVDESAVQQATAQREEKLQQLKAAAAADAKKRPPSAVKGAKTKVSNDCCRSVNTNPQYRA